MTDKEAMQMALDALESSRVFVTSREKIKHPEGTEWYDKRIEALRTALAQPENEFNPDWDAMAVMVEEQQRMAKRIEELEGQLAQPEQEPFCYHDGRNIVGKEFADHSDVFPLYTAPPLRQWHGLTEEDLFDIAIVNFGEPDLQLFIEMGKLVQEELKEKNT